MDLGDRINRHIAELLITASAVGGMAMPASASPKLSDAEPVHAYDGGALARSVQDNVKKGNYRELTPAMVTNYKGLVTVVSEQGYKGEPRIFFDTENFRREPEVIVLGKLEGRPIAVANSAAITVTAEYAKENTVVSAEEMRDWVLASKAGMPREVTEAHAKLAAKMGLSKTPPVYLNMADKSSVPKAEATITYKGEGVILINRAKMRQKPNELLGSIAHEDKHLRNGDVTPARMAAATNDPALSRAMESEADNGAKDLCRPSDLADSIQTTMAAKAQRNTTLRQGLTQEDALRGLAEANDRSTHSSFVERVKAIRGMKENTPGCISLPEEGGRKR